MIPKASLKSSKQRNKVCSFIHYLGTNLFILIFTIHRKKTPQLFSEIRIHQSLNHRYIVKFYHVFEDDENVYMILEVCENKTFVDMLRSRRRLTEPEVRYYMKQILDAVQYMHQHRVIHRDLKLGNFFLTKDMELKIGDFGLAANIVHDGERKK